MGNSVESRAKHLVSELDGLDVIDRAVELYEQGSPCVGCAVARKPRFKIETRTIAWAALLMGLFLPPLVPLDEIIGTATAFRGPAIGTDEVSVKTPVIRAGNPLILHVKSEYLRVCMWRWVHEWHTAEGVPIAIDWLPGTAHALGVITEKDLALSPPGGIKPGNYRVHISGTGDCGHGDIAQHSEPPLAFTVTD